jgi:TP901 family phage tail tape measure protein
MQKMKSQFRSLDKLAETGKGMVEAGHRMGVTGALISGSAQKMQNALSGIMAPALEAEDAMAILRNNTTSTMGSIDASLDATMKKAREWQKQHTQSAAEFIAATNSMASAGLNDIQAIAGAQAALAVATANLGETGEAAELMATVYNTMGDMSRDATEEMMRLGDMITRTGQLAQIPNLNQLAQGIANSVASAKNAQEPFSSLVTVLGALNNVGIMGAQAGTAYAATSRQMVKASRALGFELARNAGGGVDFIETLANIRERFGESSQWGDDVLLAMQTAFGEEGIKAVSLLVNQVDTLRAQLKDVENSAGATAAAQANMEATVTAQQKILANTINDVKMGIAAGLLPALNSVLPMVRSVVDRFGRFADAHPNLMRIGVLLFALATGLLMVAATLFTVISGLIMMGGHGLQAVAKLGKSIKGLSMAMKQGNIARWAGTAGKGLRQLGMIGRSGLETLQIRAMYAGDGLRRLGATGRSALLRAGSATTRFASQLGRMAVTGAQAAGRMALGLLGMARQAIFAAASALPGLIASTWAWTTALLANPITWIIIGIIALGAAIYLLIRNWGRVSKGAKNAWATVRQVVGGAVSSAINLIRSLLLFVASIIFPPLALILNWDSIRQGMEEAGGFLPWAYEQLKAVISIPLKLLGIDPAAFWESVDAALLWLQTKWQQFKAFFATPLKLLGLGVDIFQQSFDNIIAWVQTKWQVFKQSGAALWQAFCDGLKSVLNAPVDLVKQGLEAVRNLLPFSDAKEGPLSDLTLSGQRMATTLGEGVAAGMPGLHKAVAAGLASLALAVPAPAMAAPEMSLPNMPALEAPAVPGVDLPELSGVAQYNTALGALPVAPPIAGSAAYEATLTAPVAPAVTGQASYMPEVAPPVLPGIEPPVAPATSPVSGVARYDAALGALPTAPPIAGSAAYEATLTAPAAPAVTGQASYALTMMPPALVPPVTGTAAYEPSLGEVPELPSLQGQALYQTAGLPNSLPDLRGTAVFESQMADEPAGRRQELSRPETLAVKPITIMQTAAERGQQAQTGKAGKTFIVQGDLVVHIDKADDAEELIDDLWEMSEEGGFS